MTKTSELPRGIVRWPNQTIAIWTPDILGWMITGSERAWGDPNEIVKVYGDDWEQIPTAAKWWVATDLLARGGIKIAGPFTTQVDALKARAAIEPRDRTDKYWVDEEA